MITVLSGENSFEINEARQALAAAFDGMPEVVDGGELQLRQLPDLLMGATLFSDERLVILKGLSGNAAVWPVFGEWLDRISDDIQLVLIEEKLDKRTKTYKQLQKLADLREFSPWSERDSAKAEAWVGDQAKRMGKTLDKKSAQLLVGRIGVDQWQLEDALQKLAVLDEVTPKAIETIIDAVPSGNVFNLFEAALKGDAHKVHQMIATLQLSEEAYRLFGLVSSQAFQLFALAMSDRPSSEAARDLGVHPFALGKLSSYAKKLGKPGAKKIIQPFIEADAAMKTSAVDPWLLLERALIKVTQVQ